MGVEGDRVPTGGAAAHIAWGATWFLVVHTRPSPYATSGNGTTLVSRHRVLGCVTQTSSGFWTNIAREKRGEEVGMGKNNLRIEFNFRMKAEKHPGFRFLRKECFAAWQAVRAPVMWQGKLLVTRQKGPEWSHRKAPQSPSRGFWGWICVLIRLCASSFMGELQISLCLLLSPLSLTSSYLDSEMKGKIRD